MTGITYFCPQNQACFHERHLYVNALHRAFLVLTGCGFENGHVPTVPRHNLACSVAFSAETDHHFLTTKHGLMAF